MYFSMCFYELTNGNLYVWFSNNFISKVVNDIGGRDMSLSKNVAENVSLDVSIYVTLFCNDVTRYMYRDTCIAIQCVT